LVAANNGKDLDSLIVSVYSFTRITSRACDDPEWPIRDFIARHKALALALARDFPEADEETLGDTLEGASDLPSC
jgi:hypothetical protein